MEVIQMGPFSLSYWGAVSNILRGSLAFILQRCNLIYGRAYCDACTAYSPPQQWRTAARKCTPHPFQRWGEDCPIHGFLIWTSCAHRGFQNEKLFLYYSLWRSFCNSFQTVKKWKTILPCSRSSAQLCWSTCIHYNWAPSHLCQVLIIKRNEWGIGKSEGPGCTIAH